MGNVLLIGGSPMTGKSTAAAALASARRWPSLSTDDVGEVLQTVLPLDPMRGMNYRTYYASVSADGLREDARRYHAAMEPALRRLVNIHSAWGNSMILEGWALYPARVRPWLGRSVYGVWLIAEEGLLESRLEQREDFLDGAAARSYLHRSLWHNGLLLEECRALDLPYLRVREEDTPADVSRRLEALLPPGFQNGFPDGSQSSNQSGRAE